MHRKAQTLTDNVAESLARHIVDGQWAIGEQMPPETELALRYHCARITIRRALAKLEKAGMITRRPRIGTIVQSKGPGVSFGYSLSNLNDINQLGQNHQRKILSVENFVADKVFAAKFGVTVGARFERLNDLRMGIRSNDPPIVFTHVYIPERFRGVVPKAEKEPTRLVISLIEEFTGRILNEVRQHVYAEPMPVEISPLLNTSPQSPALRIIRHYIDTEGERLLLTDSWHPGTRYGFNITISRQKQIF